MTTVRDVIAGWLLDAGYGDSDVCAAAAESLLCHLSAESVRLELAALLNPWRPIEMAPKDNRCILVGGGNQSVHIDNADPDYTWDWKGAPTHWLPLPAPPSEDK